MDSKMALAARLDGLGATPARIARIVDRNPKTIRNWKRGTEFQDLSKMAQTEVEPEATIVLCELLGSSNERVRLDAARELRRNAVLAGTQDEPLITEFA